MATLSEIAQIVTRQRIFVGLSQGELATASKVGLSTIQRIEQGREPMPTALILSKLSKVLGDMVGPDLLPADLPSGISDDFDARPIPTWEIDLTAGGWAQIPSMRLDSDDPEQAEVIRTGRFRLTIRGTCMEPDYKDGETVEFEIIRYDEGGFVPGQAYAICRSDGTATFKTLQRADDDTITLAAINQRDFPGELEFPRQEICRVARVANRLLPPAPAKVVKIRKR